MAWVLGLFITDGNVNSSNHSITFSQKDERILHLIAKYIEADYILAPFGPTKTTPSLLINSKEIKKDLQLLGITANKSLTVPFPDVPEEFLPSFVRGIIDGDGWVDKEGYTMNVTTGSIKFALGLVSTCQSWGIKAELNSMEGHKSHCLYRVWIKGKNQLKVLSSIIYQNINNDNFVIHKRIYMTQHSDRFYYQDDYLNIPRWKLMNGKLIHTDTSRISFRTNISLEVLKKLDEKAAKLNVPKNFLIEKGLNDIVSHDLNLLHYTRPTDRIQYKTTFDKELLEEVKKIAKMNGVFINDLIEFSIKYIDNYGWDKRGQN